MGHIDPRVSVNANFRKKKLLRPQNWTFRYTIQTQQPTFLHNFLKLCVLCVWQYDTDFLLYLDLQCGSIWLIKIEAFAHRGRLYFVEKTTPQARTYSNLKNPNIATVMQWGVQFQLSICVWHETSSLILSNILTESVGMEGISWKQNDAIEIQALIGVYLEAMNQSMFPTELIWNKNSGDRMARSTFKRNRFLNVSNRLWWLAYPVRHKTTRCISPHSRRLRKKKLNALRQRYNAGAFLTIDEQFIP